MINTVAKNLCPRGNPPSAEVPSLYAADGHRKYLNREERLRAIEAMHGLDTDKALFALTLAWTGARVSEVLALTPSSFQIERGVVAFITLKRRCHSVREVPLPGDLIGALDRHYKLRGMQADPRVGRERLTLLHAQPAKHKNYLKPDSPNVIDLTILSGIGIVRQHPSYVVQRFGKTRFFLK
jgi:integrase